MSPRYGNGGARGRRQVDDTPLTDGLVEVVKGRGDLGGMLRGRAFSTRTVAGHAEGARSSGQAATTSRAESNKATALARRHEYDGNPSAALESRDSAARHTADATRHSDNAHASIRSAEHEAKRVRNTAAIAAGGTGASTGALIGASAAREHHKKQIKSERTTARSGRVKAYNQGLAQAQHNVGKSAEFAKTRSYDPEHQRQQAMGAAQAGLAAGGATAAGYGGKGIARSTKRAHSATGVSTRSTGSARARAEATRSTLKTIKGGVNAGKKDLALVGGGVAAIGAGAAVRQHANSRRGKAWD
jgi:hypothetical protein